MLKLYGFPLSQPTRSVLMLLKETATPYSFVLIDALKGDNRKNPEFKAAFPGNALVPTIDDDGFKLMESAAILSYLAETRGLDKYYPQKDAKARARINAWMHWHHQNSRNSTKGILTPALFKGLPDRDAHLARGTKAYTAGLKHMDLHLATSQYLAGGKDVSLADLLILCEVDQLYPEAFNLFDYKAFGHVQRWVADCRKSIKSYEEVYAPVKAIADAKRSSPN